MRSQNCRTIYNCRAEGATKKEGHPKGIPLFGAGGGTRTHTMSPPTDFESVTSTNSITPACNSVIIADTGENCKDYFFLLLNPLHKIQKVGLHNGEKMWYNK